MKSFKIEKTENGYTSQVSLAFSRIKSNTSGSKQIRSVMSGFKSSAVFLYWVSPLESVASDLERF